MQRIFNKYGEFKYNVILTCKEEDLLCLEQGAIDQFFGDRAYMNTNPIAGKPPSRKGIKVSDESKAKMSAAAIGKTRSDSDKAAISASLIGNKRSLGIKHSEETKLKMAASAKIRWEKKNAS